MNRQTFTILKLEKNDIGNEGAKHLAEILRNNQVFLSHLIVFLESLFSFS